MIIDYNTFLLELNSIIFAEILQILQKICKIYAMFFTKCHVSTSFPQVFLLPPPTKERGKLGVSIIKNPSPKVYQ